MVGKRTFFVLLLSALSLAGCSRELPQRLQLYPEGVPQSNGLEGAEEWLEGGRVTNVTDPWMELYLPESGATGQCVVICPGGAYVRLASDHEGTMFAKWLTERGVAAAVLFYRMPNGHSEVPRGDVLRAIELIREGAAGWNIDPSKVGVMGFSAGGHLAATAMTKYDSQANRPDFGALFYPVISMKDGVTHERSRLNLLGDDWAEGVEQWSLEEQASEQTPPCFIAYSENDGSVAPANSTLFYEALVAHSVEAEIHSWPVGGHGWGFSGEEFAPHHKDMLARLERWLVGLNNQ